MVARQTYPLDGGNAALAPALRVQFEIPDGVIVPQAPEVRGTEGAWVEHDERYGGIFLAFPITCKCKADIAGVAAVLRRTSLYAHASCLILGRLRFCRLNCNS